MLTNLTPRTLTTLTHARIRIFTRTFTREDRAKPSLEGAVIREANALRTQAQSKSGRPIRMLQADAELMEKLEEISGEGGVAGLELEDGKPTAMRRGVRDNMFRLI
ncbi:hypothetical protein BDQ17DRAFT_1548205 [Cyathus striatus]|nr:hypothetical protein BDQ17DRAFT_1548205 [Cyathus striatus]